MFFRYKIQTYFWRIRKGFLLLCLFFFCLFCMLGVWQVQRFHFKKDLVTLYQNKLKELPKPFILLLNDNMQFQPISVDGYYLNALTMFVQNRMYKGKIGYEILTPLKIDGETRLLLVNRGWVPGRQISALPAIKERQHLSGYTKQELEYQFILGKNILEPITYPLVMQKIDLKQIEQITRQSFFPYVLRLDPNVPHGFVRDWVISFTPPEKHRMYAIQWFSMAFVLLLAFICFSLERVKKS